MVAEITASPWARIAIDSSVVLAANSRVKDHRVFFQQVY